MPALVELKASIKNMSADMQSNLLSTTDMLQEMYMSESEVDPIKTMVNKYLDEV